LRPGAVVCTSVGVGRGGVGWGSVGGGLRGWNAGGLA